MANLNKYGEVSDASQADTVIIQPVQISTGKTGRGLVYDFGVESDPDAGGALLKLQLSNDGTTWTTITRLVIPSPGVQARTWGRPLEIRKGQYFRVVGKADGVGVLSADLSGEAFPQDIVDV